MALYELNGSDVTSGFHQGVAPPFTTTGFEENGTDMGDKYSACNSHTCSGSQLPICDALPPEYAAATGANFWTGVCTQ